MKALNWIKVSYWNLVFYVESLWHHWRAYAGGLLWLVAVFALAVAAEGVHKNEWIMLGSVPITLLCAGFIFNRR